MKVLSRKALSGALRTAVGFLNTSLTYASPTDINESVVIQQVVHLNKSTIDDLVTLKGIGHKKAQAILSYRDQIGGFKSVEDLIKVKGIGEKVLSDNVGRLKI